MKTFSIYTLIITYYMALVGMSATALVDGVNASFVFAVTALAAVSLVLNVKGKQLIPARLWNALAAAVLTFFLVDYMAISGNLIAAGSRFLSILLALKLFDLQKDRDYILAYSLVFFQVLASAASTVSALFFVIISLFILGSIWAMIVFNVKKDWQEGARKTDSPPVEFGLRFFTYIVTLSAVSLIITFTLFFILPRIGIGLLQRKNLNTIKVTGFSERVDLGAMGPLKTDPTVIMRVELLNNYRPKGLIYFRGTALDHYDGSSWSRTIKMDTLVRKGRHGLLNLGKADGELVEQNIQLEPLDTEFIFAASHAVSVKGGFSNLWIDASGSMRLPAPPYSAIEYRTWSDLSPLKQENGPVAPEYKETSYLDSAPEGKRIKKLAEEITKRKKTDGEKAAAILGYLKYGFTYTLDPKQGKGAPLEDFLFSARQGYCEHFATAMVMLLRSAGIPARIVSGFLQGEWNSLGNYFIVRQQDAHSWVEAYIDGQGWVTLDPTPSAGSTGDPSRLSLYLDLLRMKWNRYIINFNFKDQKNIAGAIGNGSSGILKKIKAALQAAKDGGPLYVLPVISAALIMAAFFAVLRRTYSRKNFLIPEYYNEMLRFLGKKGFVRNPTETPMEFARRVDNSLAAEITMTFQAERYGGHVSGKDELDKVKKALEELKRA